MSEETLPIEIHTMEEIINPSEFTEKELLKLVYRDLHKLRTEFEDYKNNNNAQSQYQKIEIQISKLENTVEFEKKLREEGHKQQSRVLYVIGFVIATLEFIFKFFIK